MPVTVPVTGAADALRRLASARDARDVEAWRWLIEELGPAIRRVAGRLSDDAASADDAAQEALLTIRDHAGSFRPRLDPDADAQRWVLRVAANAALALGRQRRRARARDARAAAPAEVPGTASDTLEREETGRLVRDALATLGEAERTAIVLRVVEGLGYDQVAAELRCAEGTAKSRVSRGLERLRERLGRRQLALGAIVASLAQSGSDGGLPASAYTLINAPQAATVAAVPATFGGLTMAAKLGITLALVVAAATPLALPAQNQEQKPAAVPAVAAPAPATNPAAVDPLDAALATKVTFDFQDQSLSDILAFLRQLAPGLTVVLAPDVHAGNVTLRVKDMPLSDALKWIFQLSSLHQTRGDRFLLVSAAATADAAALAKVPQEVRARLAKPVTVSFDDTDLADALAFLHNSTDLNIIIDPRLPAGAKVSFTAQAVPLKAALEMACASAGIGALWKDGALLLTAPTTSF